MEISLAISNGQKRLVVERRLAEDSWKGKTRDKIRGGGTIRNSKPREDSSGMLETKGESQATNENWENANLEENSIYKDIGKLIINDITLNRN